jgi:hypothetical protein
VRDSLGCSVLEHACQKRNPRIVALLIKMGANVEGLTTAGTPLKDLVESIVGDITPLLPIKNDPDPRAEGFPPMPGFDRFDRFERSEYYAHHRGMANRSKISRDMLGPSPGADMMVILILPWLFSMSDLTS